MEKLLCIGSRTLNFQGQDGPVRKATLHMIDPEDLQNANGYDGFIPVPYTVPLDDFLALGVKPPCVIHCKIKIDASRKANITEMSSAAPVKDLFQTVKVGK